MGNENTNTIVDAHGKQVVRNCIIFVMPPGYQVHKMLDNFPEQFPYRYISIGELIRHEINKKTKYSKIILQSLEKNKKISKQLLGILLRTVALRGNFMIRYSVLDDGQLSVWKDFMSKVDVELVAIIKPNRQELEDQENNHHRKEQINQRLIAYFNDVKTVKSSFQAKSVRQFGQNEDIAQEIMSFLKKIKIGVIIG